MFGLHVTKRLLAFEEGRLSAGERRRVAAHLERCHHCRHELESIRFAASALREAPLHSAPDSLWNEIESELNSETSSPARVVRQSLRPAWMPWMYATAGLTLTLVVLVFLLRTHREPGWSVTRLTGSQPTATGTLHVGQWLVTGPDTRARVAVSQIGEVEVAPNSRLRLLRSRPSDNRLSLARGEISARIWAPPRLFFVETPSAVAVDLGCAYDLKVDDHGGGLLHVTIGWVELDDRGRKSLAPAGAMCRMRPGFGPGTPYFDDAPPQLADALARFDFGGDKAALRTVIADARPRDALTLVHLLARTTAEQRPAILDKLVALQPLPEGVTRAGALSADPETLRRWIDHLAWGW